MSYRPQVKSDSNGTTQDLPIDAETVQGKIPVFTTTNQTISGVKTYNGNQIFKGYLDIRGTAAEKHLKTRGIGGSDGNGNESDLYLQYNSNYSTKFGKSGNGSLNSDGTITEAGTLLSKKYASKSTTLSGYGITNAYTKTETNNLINSKTKTVVFDTYNKFIQFLEDTSQATYDYFNVGDSIYIKEEGSDYWISGKEDIVEGGYSYNRIISGRTGSDLLGTDNIYRKTVTVNIGTTYTSVEVYEVKPQSEAGYSNFSWNSSTGDVKITLESLRPNTEVTVTLKTYTPASAGGDYGYYNISNIGPTKVSELTNDSGYLTTLAAANKYLPLSGGTLTGNLTGKYITGTWLQTTAASDLGKAPPKYGVISEGGWLYTRTLEETKSDLGINSKSPVESVIDYGDTTNTIKIGYRGNGLTASQIAYIAGYSNVTDPNNPNEHKIKDISKDVLKSWLGYTEVATGTIRNNSLNIADGTYLWIVYPTSGSTTSFSFTSGNSTYTAYHFAIIQSGHPGSVRYFTNPTTLAIVKNTSVGFSGSSGEVHYIKFKIE